jgi:hypothetical protein
MRPISSRHATGVPLRVVLARISWGVLGQVQGSQRFIHLPRNLAIEAMKSLTEVNDTRFGGIHLSGVALGSDVAAPEGWRGLSEVGGGVSVLVRN